MIREAIARGFILPMLYASTISSTVFIFWCAFASLKEIAAPWQIGILIAIPVFWIVLASGMTSYNNATGVHRSPPVVHHQLTVPFITTQDGHEGLKLDGVDVEQWTRICRAIKDNDMCASEAILAGAGVKRAAYQHIRSQMVGRGILAWRNPRAPTQGVTLTLPGAKLIRYYADGLK